MRILNRTVAALLLSALPLAAQEDIARMALPELLAALADPATEEWELVERRILREWSRSGSPALDLLMRRGREALAAGDPVAAAEHFTAILERAPDFAEAWNARATAYYQAGDAGPSLDDIARTLALNPHHFGALSGLGTILEETGNLDGAQAAFAAARAIHPHHPGIQAALERVERALSGRTL